MAHTLLNTAESSRLRRRTQRTLLMMSPHVMRTHRLSHHPSIILSHSHRPDVPTGYIEHAKYEDDQETMWHLPFSVLPCPVHRGGGLRGHYDVPPRHEDPPSQPPPIHHPSSTFNSLTESLNTGLPEPHDQAHGRAVGRAHTMGGNTAVRYGRVKTEQKCFPKTGSNKLPRSCDMTVGNPPN
ncbi:hypothetical protein GOBAR_AA15679 [Gossypium barbadense]|uniref:Uncharacterized protein n=1 Tax=Gossypium barbadense TaxID=3634 RepID=A0A2P5XNS3_GOSBA|nr:hypothetical protein GOBAR_AA15679 [Gossypium barbadense]